MAALACPAVHALGSAENITPCRAAAHAWLARGMLPVAALPSQDCAVEILLGGKNRESGHGLLPLARLFHSCITEAENCRFSGVCAPPFPPPSPPPFQPLLPPPFRTPVPTHLPTLILTLLHTLLGTHLRTPLGTLLGTPFRPPFPPLFPPLFRQVCATFSATSPNTLCGPPNHPDFPPPSQRELLQSFGRSHSRYRSC